MEGRTHRHGQDRLNHPGSSHPRFIAPTNSAGDDFGSGFTNLRSTRPSNIVNNSNNVDTSTESESDDELGEWSYSQRPSKKHPARVASNKGDLVANAKADEKAVKSLSFKKNKNPSSTSTKPQEPPVASSSRPQRNILDLSSDGENDQSTPKPSRVKPQSALHKQFKQPLLSQASKAAPATNASSAKPLPKISKKPSQRPAPSVPKPPRNRIVSSDDSEEEMMPLKQRSPPASPPPTKRVPKAVPAEFPLSGKAQAQSPSRRARRNSSPHSPRAQRARRQPDLVPDSSSLDPPLKGKEVHRDSSQSSQSTRKSRPQPRPVPKKPAADAPETQARETKRSKKPPPLAKAPTVADWPMSPPKSSQDATLVNSDEPQAFPDLSPLRKASTSKRTPPKKVLQDFPMDSQDFRSSLSPRPEKRLSDGGGEPSSKRRKDITFDDLDISIGDDSFLDLNPPLIDPTTLCPYCDTVLPEIQSDTLKALFAETRRKTWPTPRHNNPLARGGRTMADWIAVCHRHNFESQVVPEAKAEGWPTKHNWPKVTKRIEKMEPALRAILLDFEIGDEHPRERCIFWAEMQERGARSFGGVKGLFATFQKTQPGYYGEQGSLIIHRKLEEMFPTLSIDPNIVAPLTPGNFIEHILLPETAARLIMEDRRLVGGDAMDKAVAVLRQSARYGVIMFPEDALDEDDDGEIGEGDLGVADALLMKRAQQRRQEIERSEGDDDDEVLFPPPAKKQTGRAASKTRLKPGTVHCPPSTLSQDDSFELVTPKPPATPRAQRAASRGRSRSRSVAPPSPSPGKRRFRSKTPLSASSEADTDSSIVPRSRPKPKAVQKSSRPPSSLASSNGKSSDVGFDSNRSNAEESTPKPIKRRLLPISKPTNCVVLGSPIRST
ncbi:hypothetical protein DL96DRAFT_1583686 [Flagelloscypha sp. PMI_526]|nr:hypothetical protein DL96DRAFT_1583686 [Flagelloscypha sp. PMI_526]